MPDESPEARADDIVETLYGIQVSDPYRWLEDADDEAVQAWARAQDAAARAFLERLPGRPEVRRRLEQTLGGGYLGGSVPRSGRRFFTRREPHHDQPALFCADATGPRQLFDPAAGSEHGTTSLDWWQVSRDGELVCLGVSEHGSEDSSLRLLRVADATFLPEAISHCRLAAVDFEPSGAGLLYTRFPDPASVPRGRSSITATSGAT